MDRVSLDLTVISWVIASIVGYYGLIFLASFARRRPPRSSARPLMVLLVPARNEELVLDETLASLTALHYDGRFRVLVVDDASTDSTADIARRWVAADPRVRLSQRVPPEAGQGKSEVLNHAYRLVNHSVAGGDPWLGADDDTDVVLVIVDADGRLESSSLTRVAPYFGDPSVASVQIGVRIANARDNYLARMQDIEFVGFTWLVQIARDWVGSSGLGGNGQFTKLAALRTLGDEPWQRGALTEDLDLGLRLVRGGWRTRFCHTTFVDQQGLTSWRPLLRQRTRWIQGHYQCWRHLRGLSTARRVPLATRLDLSLYLLLVVTVLVVSFTAVAGVLAAAGLIDVTNDFLTFVPDGVPRRLTSLGIAVLPVAIFLWTYQRHSAYPFRWHQLPAAGFVFTLYGYVWFFVSVRALGRLARRRNAWVKTPRLAAPG